MAADWGRAALRTQNISIASTVANFLGAKNTAAVRAKISVYSVVLALMD